MWVPRIIGKYERDQMQPGVETARRLADALHVSLDYLTGAKETEAVSEETLKRVQEIERLPDDERTRVFHVIDALIRDAQARPVYGVD